MLEFKHFITEGLEDTASFKAIMMAGGAGSGKSFVIQMAGLRAVGMKVSNSDPHYEGMLAKAGLTLSLPMILCLRRVKQSVEMQRYLLINKKKCG